MLAATLQAVNAADVQALVVTGDLIDNAQANELDQAADSRELAFLDAQGGRPRDLPGARRTATRACS